MRSMHSLARLGLTLVSLHRVMAFDLNRNDNLVVYWGQNIDSKQQPLAFYCQDDTIDVIPLAFLHSFSSTGGMPSIDFASSCSPATSAFSGTALAKCDNIGNDIKTCQKAGKIVTLSLGGATGEVGFASEVAAKSFADTIWDLFLGGNSSTRPFGDAVLDGVDLDIETNTAAYYANFVNQIRSRSGADKSHSRRKKKDGSPPDVTKKDKRYYITAAPQCPFPDAHIGDALNQAPFDAVYVQFYNNYCGLNNKTQFNLGTWDDWAHTKSANKNIKVYLGAPGAPKAANDGQYVSPETLAGYVSDAKKKYKSFGGVMLWEAGTAYNNSRFDKAAKNALKAN